MFKSKNKSVLAAAVFLKLFSVIVPVTVAVAALPAKNILTLSAIEYPEACAALATICVELVTELTVMSLPEASIPKPTANIVLPALIPAVLSSVIVVPLFQAPLVLVSTLKSFAGPTAGKATAKLLVLKVKPLIAFVFEEP